MEAQDYKKLIEALRLCQFGECGCGKCYYKELKGDWCTEDNHPEFFDCDDKLKLDAADAIEALQAAEPTERQVVDYCHKRCLVVLEADLFHELKASYGKMPKRGEWLPPNEHRPMWECSRCGWYVDEGGRKDFTYCPNCGARMKGADDE